MKNKTTTHLVYKDEIIVVKIAPIVHIVKNVLKVNDIKIVK